MAFRRSGVRPSLAPPRFLFEILTPAEDAQKTTGRPPALFVSGDCAKYGREAEASPGVRLDDVPGFRDLPPIDRYDIAIRRIAEKAPLRLCGGERRDATRRRRFPTCDATRR